jgi:Na+/melibiose symporter-like transporter
VQVSQIVGVENKEYYLSFVGIFGLITIFTTPTFGALSDKTNFKFGKRRTYIAVAIPISVLFFILLSFFTSNNMINIAILSFLFCLCRVSTSLALGILFLIDGKRTLFSFNF